MGKKKPDEPWEYPKGEGDGPEVIERYGPGKGEVVVWDTGSNFSRVRDMRLEGKTVPQIAAALDIKVSEVRRALTNALKVESAHLDDNEMGGILGLELERLDHLLQSYWYAAKAGDLDAGNFVLKISQERRNWLKWARPEPEAQVGITNNVLVVGGNESEFLAGLEQARGYIEGQVLTNGGRARLADEDAVQEPGDD